MKKRGFTLVELLVVIAIIAMLLAILMPALGKVRQLAYRMMCGTNLKGLGNAMMVYANDYEESLPKAAGSSTIWEPTNSAWKNIWDDADATNVERSTAGTTVSASLYLLVKYADVSPAQFVCQASDEKKFELNLNTETTPSTTGMDITGCWDFGEATTVAGPWDYVSYSYQLPYPVVTGGTSYPASISGSAGLALMADKSPYFDKGLTDSQVYNWTGSDNGGDIDKQGANFAKAQTQDHQTEGQNVLFTDSHVAFEKVAAVGVGQDNIYTYWGITTGTATDKQKQVGTKPTRTTAKPISQEDNILVNDLP